MALTIGRNGCTCLGPGGMELRPSQPNGLGGAGWLGAERGRGPLLLRLGLGRNSILTLSRVHAGVTLRPSPYRLHWVYAP
jgi:hypothetical protein